MSTIHCHKRLARKIVFLAGFLTLYILMSGCKTDSEKAAEVASPEDLYFQDYESTPEKWGFIDTAGNVVIPARYDQVSVFREGLAPVNLDGRWGYIDRDDSIVIPFAFREAWQFSGGVARVLLFDGSPCMVFPDGRQVCPADVTELYDHSEGTVGFQRGMNYGFLDTRGNVLIEPMYEQVWPFEDGVARVMLLEKQGLIDKSGTVVLPLEYDRVYPPASGRILVKQDGRLFYLRPDGARALDHMYLQATPFEGHVAAVADDRGWYLIDTLGQPLTEERYEHLRYAGFGRWIVRLIGRSGVLDRTATPLTPFDYTQINRFSEGYAGYEREELWGFLDTLGRELTPPQFGLVWDFREGLARAAFSDGIAFINLHAEIPFLPVSFEMRDFSEGLAAFQQ